MEFRIVFVLLLAVVGLYCVIWPDSAKSSLRLGRFDERTNLDWMSNGTTRLIGLFLIAASMTTNRWF
jgi:hypothetical protein